MIKHKKWIGEIFRSKPLDFSRYGKICLDKNERVEKLEKIFFKKFISKIRSDQINLYPEVGKLYKILAKFHKLQTNQFVLTSGIDGAIKTCFELFVSKGDRVVVLQPTFAMVDIYCKISKAKKIGIQYDKNLNLDIKKLVKKIDRKTSLVIIANPNSPTGTIIPKLNMVEIIKKAKNLNIPVLVDEAYYEFCKQSALPLLKKYQNLIVARTFSKAYGLAGLRIGYLVANKKIAKILYNLKPMYEINSLGILAARTVLENSKISKNYTHEVKKGLKILVKYLQKNNISFFKTHANFIYVYAGRKLNYLYDKMQKFGILVKKGLEVKGYENYLRITLCPPKQIKIVISKLKNLNLV